jgi:hypothetical protein
MAEGDLVPGTGYGLAALNGMDARTATARALAAYLTRAQFVVPNLKEPDKDVGFRLLRAYDYFPNVERNLEYPSVSIVEAVTTPDPNDLAPTPLEETFGVFGPDTVLWKTGELTIEFQVDFWFNEEPQRQAVLAQLPWLFAPHEDASDIQLECSHEYFKRTARFSLGDMARPDTSDAAMQLSRRARVTILADIELVHLRRAARIRPVLRYP